MRFENAIDIYHDEIYRYLYRLCLAGGIVEPVEEAADLTQDTFERAYQAYDRLSPGSNVRAWLYRIAGNRARDQHRSRSRAQHHLKTQEPRTGEFNIPEDQLLEEQDRSWLRQQLAQLPTKQRQAVTLRFLQELEYQDIGEILSCSPASARANVYQGLQQLRAVYMPRED